MFTLGTPIGMALAVNKIWRIWKYALGSFSDEKTKQYDNYIVLVRTIILLTYFTTNIFIVAGVVRHWNPNYETQRLSLQHQPVQEGHLG